MRNISPKDQADLDAVETREWLESLDYVLQSGGPAKVARLLRELTTRARQNGVKLPFSANTPYINTIPADEQVLMPGSPDLERRIKSLVRWNAAAMLPLSLSYDHRVIDGADAIRFLRWVCEALEQPFVMSLQG